MYINILHSLITLYNYIGIATFYIKIRIFRNYIKFKYFPVGGGYWALKTALKTE